MTIKAIQFGTASEALQYANAAGGEVVSLAGVAGYLVTAKAEAERAFAAGVEGAYFFLHAMPDGSDRVMSVPVN